MFSLVTRAGSKPTFSSIGWRRVERSAAGTCWATDSGLARGSARRPVAVGRW